MKISYSRYSAFMTNMERFRMYYGLGIVPEGEAVASSSNYGRRRGTCTHAILDARAKGLPVTAETFKDFPPDLFWRCYKLAAVVPDLGPFLLSEQDFEIPIGDGRHSITGRLDHVFKRDDRLRLGDFKTTKKRTKNEMAQYMGELETSPQAHFYLHAAAVLGYPTDQFTYHVLVDDKNAPDYIPLDVKHGPAAVARKMSCVYAACEGIEFYTQSYGVDKPWPHSNAWPCNGDRFFCGYSSICERAMPNGCVPPGYVSRRSEVTEEGS